MVEVIEGQRIDELCYSPRSVTDRRYVNCEFYDPGMTPGLGADPAERSTVENVEVESCRVTSKRMLFSGVVFRDVVCADLKGEIRAMHCAFVHVKVVGFIRSLYIASFLNRWPDDAAAREFWTAVVADNDRIYADGEWALDISEAQLGGDWKIQGVPAELIKVNAETQAVITPESMAGAEDIFGDRELPGVTGFTIRQYVQGWDFYGGDPERRRRDAELEPVVSVARRSRHRAAELELVKMLHDNGLALPV